MSSFSTPPETDAPVISIIMPVFNSEETLAATLDSLLRQSFTPWELIAVNDGSTDASLAILEQYAARDTRIHPCSQENRGPSAARNKGIELARGQWILFQDSDDLARPELLRELLEAVNASGSGMAAGGLRLIYPGGKEDFAAPLEQGAGHGRATVPAALAARYIYLSPWCKLFRRSLMNRHGIRFPEDFRYAEDMIFLVRYLIFSHDVALVDAPLLDYIVRQGSLYSTHIRKAPNLQQNLHFMDTIAGMGELIPASYTRQQRREYGKAIASRYFSELAVIRGLYHIRRQRGFLRFLLGCMATSLPKLIRSSTPESTLRIFIHFLRKSHFRRIHLHLADQMRERES